MHERALMMLTGAAIALGAVLAHHLVTEAHADAGQWQCYVVDRFPDKEGAAAWNGANKHTLALNAVAPDAPTGTIVTSSFPIAGQLQTGNAPILCVKR
ncbi:MAG: hypothetical protein ABIO70_33070 [Pseudomonadota bacterium]